MNLKYYYWYFPSAIPERICDEIVRYGKEQDKQMALTGDAELNNLTTLDVKNIQKKRKSDVVWMSDRWIYKEIQPYIHQANANAGWNFEWDWSESCQFTKYGVGQYYGWHCDSWTQPYDRSKHRNEQGILPPDHGKIRKLSVTVSLNDPSEYEGGNLEFDFRNDHDWERNKKSSIKACTEIRPRGSIIVFPSFCWHRVAPVTKGTRYSLVMWNLGRPFR